MPRPPMALPTRRNLVMLGGLTGLGVLTGCSTQKSSPEPSEEPNESLSKKPVLYLYPTKTTELSVSLDYDGTLTYTYPTPQTQADGAVTWHMTASPDGDLTDVAGRHYPSLFWEGEGPIGGTQNDGFVVEADTATGFLEEKLSILGLSEHETAEFITFWGPRIAERGRWSPSPLMSTFAKPSTASQTSPPALMLSRTPSSGSTSSSVTCLRRRSRNRIWFLRLHGPDSPPWSGAEPRDR